MIDAQRAAKLRRALHDACARADLAAMRETLDALFEADDSPLGSKSEVSNPAAFAALVEVCCLAQAHAALAPEDSGRAAVATEMEENVARLRDGFGIDSATFRGIRRALSRCETARSLEEAQRYAADALTGTQLQGRVKVARHSVSYAP